jgi:hypothetical protein
MDKSSTRWRRHREDMSWDMIPARQTQPRLEAFGRSHRRRLAWGVGTGNSTGDIAVAIPLFLLSIADVASRELRSKDACSLDRLKYKQLVDKTVGRQSTGCTIGHRSATIQAWFGSDRAPCLRWITLLINDQRAAKLAQWHMGSERICFWSALWKG